MKTQPTDAGTLIKKLNVVPLCNKKPHSNNHTINSDTTNNLHCQKVLPCDHAAAAAAAAPKLADTLTDKQTCVNALNCSSLRNPPQTHNRIYNNNLDT